MFIEKRHQISNSSAFERNVLSTLLWFTIVGSTAVASPWTTHSRELIRTEDRKGVNSGEAAATLLPNYFRPKFSRYTPFMTEDSLPAPVYGRLLQRYRGSRPRASVESGDEPGRLSTTRKNVSEPRDSAEGPGRTASAGIGGRRLENRPNYGASIKSTRNRPRDSYGSGSDEKDNRQKYRSGDHNLAPDSRESRESSHTPRNRSAIRLPPSFTRPPNSSERKFHRPSSPRSSEPDSREIVDAHNNRDRHSIKNRDGGARRGKSSHSNESDESRNRKPIVTSSINPKTRPTGSVSYNRNELIDPKQKYSSREKHSRESRGPSKVSKESSSRKESREETLGSVRSKPLLFNGSASNSSNSYKIDKSSSETFKSTDRQSTVISLGSESEKYTRINIEPTTVTTTVISSKNNGSGELRSNEKYRAGRLFHRKPQPSDEIRPATGEYVGREDTELKGSNNSSNNVRTLESATSLLPESREKTRTKEIGEMKQLSPTKSSERTLTSRSKSSEEHSAERFEKAPARPKPKPSAEGDRDREASKRPSSFEISVEQTRSALEKPSARRLLTKSSSESRSSESHNRPSKKPTISHRDSVERSLSSRKNERKFTSEDSSERPRRLPHIPTAAQPRRPPAAPPRLPPPPAPSQFFGEFAAGQMFPQFGQPGRFPVQFPFPDFNAPPLGTGRGPRALI